MAKLQFLKKVTYTSEAPGFEDVKVTLKDPGEEDAYFKGADEAEKLGQLMQKNVSELKGLRKVMRFCDAYVEKIENLDVDFGKGMEKVTDLKPLFELKGMHLMTVVVFIGEIVQKMRTFGQTLKKK